MNVKIAPDWQELLAPEFEKPYFAQLVDFVRNEYATQRIYPRGSNIFRAFVLLLNSVLTVRAHQAASHAGRGWETFTDAVVRAIAERKTGIVYMLWGSYAQRKGAIASPLNNCILKAVHPSPLSVYRGFFGCRHFSQANEYLLSHGKEPIVW